MTQPAIPWTTTTTPAPASIDADDHGAPPPTAGGTPTDADFELLCRTRRAGLVRRNVPLSPATTARLRLVAVLLDSPVSHALIHPTTHFLGSGQPIPKRATRSGHTLPGEPDAKTRTQLLLPKETWTEISARTKDEGRTIAELIDAALAPYLNRARTLVAVVTDEER